MDRFSRAGSVALAFALLPLAVAAMTPDVSPGRAALPMAPHQTDMMTVDNTTTGASLFPDTNFGSDLQLHVGGTTVRGGFTNYRTFLRFDAITTTIPAGAEIDRAILRLESLGSSGSLSIVATVVSDTWSETTLTWNNQPGAHPPEALRAVGTAPGVYDWNVTEHVQAWVDGALPNHGFLLAAEDESLSVFKTFRSRRDTGSGPIPDTPVTLEVEWHRVTPTPTLTGQPRETLTPTPTTPRPTAVTPTETPTPTDRSPTGTPPTRTATPTATRTAERGTPTSTPPAEATSVTNELDLTIDGGCDQTLRIGAVATIQIRASISGTVALDRLPGPLSLGAFEVEPEKVLQVLYTVRGPSGRHTLVAEHDHDEGLVAVCGFDVTAAPTPEPSPTRGDFGFAVQTPRPPEVFLPLAANKGKPQGPTGLAAPSAKAREGDVEWVSSLPHPRYIVSAAGNGGNYRLSTWTIGSGANPTWVADGPTVQGYDVRVARLSSGLGAVDGIDRLIVSASRREGHLWLVTWQVTDGGQLVKKSTLGYGRDAVVAGYAIAARPIVVDGDLVRYQIVTPILTNTGQVRVLSWSVNRTTGALNGTDDTGDWQLVDSASDLDITYLPNAEVHLDPNLGFSGGESYDSDWLFAMTFRNTDGDLGQWILQVLNSGGIGWFGGGESGVDVRNTGSLTYGMTVGRVVPVGRSGFIVVRRDGATDPDVISWDYRSDADVIGLVPHRLGRSDWDLDPDSKGVTLADDNAADPSFIGDDVDGERAIVTDDSWEDVGEAAGEIFSKTALGKGAAGGIASVTKLMTLLVTIDAIKAGEVDLDDVVIVPAEGAEGSPAWMQPPLEAGDQVELRTLLHGLMKRSSNGAARSIASHVAGAKYGQGLSYADRLEAFLEDMNDRADGLGMGDTLYCAPQGGSHSSPQDQITLWRELSDEPLFLQFTGVNTYDPPCGKDVNDDLKCFGDMSKGTMSVPGLDAEKNGLKTNNSGVGYQNNVLACDAFSSNSTFDACRQCRIAQLTRVGRSFIGATFQSDSSANDVRDLLDYAIRKRFTPDRRAQGSDKGVVLLGEHPTDFALASLSNEPAVSMVVTEKGDVRVCTISTSAGGGSVSATACTTRVAPELGPGGSFTPDVAGSVEMVRVDALAEAEADVLTAHIVNDAILRLRLWRVGPREPTW